MNSINNTESASQIGYNNTTSGLTATDVQGAVDELNDDITDLNRSSFKKVLLWRHSNPDTGTLADSTLNIPTLYQYDWVAIVWKYTNTVDSVPTIQHFKIYNGAKEYLSAFRFELDNTQTFPRSLSGVSRQFNFTNEGIHFYNSIMLYLSDMYINWSNRCVPIEIYGIKL